MLKIGFFVPSAALSVPRSEKMKKRKDKKYANGCVGDIYELLLPRESKPPKPAGKVRLFHVGRKAPKGFKELPGGTHLGKGIWILPIEPIGG